MLGLLAGLDVPSAGSVRLAGQDLFALDEDGCARLRANHVGFVFQSFQLLPNLTALENVMLPLELAGQPAREPPRPCSSGWLGERLHHYPRTLSGGEQQRVSLARAFVVNPDLLFADEPTGSLDAATGEKVIDLMFDLHREHGATLVLVTHDPQLARVARPPAARRTDGLDGLAAVRRRPLPNGRRSGSAEFSPYFALATAHPQAATTASYSEPPLPG